MVATEAGFRKINLSDVSVREYLQSQLIAYIGNKRSLLSFLGDVFISLDVRHPIRTFLDPFAGSGSVSRLAKVLGLEVHASDWEFYSWIVNSCHVACDRREVGELFAGNGGLEMTLAKLQAEGEIGPEYISRHFAPARTAEADYRVERLFYTHENALFIDRVRNRIEELYPGWDLAGPLLQEKTILVSMLLYQAATHANTSGVFKACHKGFGGHSGDALGRIMAPMRLRPPVLVDGTRRCTACRGEAQAFTAGRPADLVYLDPPYNIHQYGSNYFMLNTIALWDRPEVPAGRGADGRLREKAGIRKDWKLTRSPYCSRASALPALSALLDSVDARYIVLSYNTEGIIPFEELVELLCRHGRVDLFGSDYTVYRGGKQSLARKTSNVEFALVLERGARNASSSSTRFRRFRIEREIGTLLRGPFVPERLSGSFPREGQTVLFGGSPNPGGGAAAFGAETDLFYRFKPFTVVQAERFAVWLSGRTLADLETLRDTLAGAAAATNHEEATVLLRLLSGGAPVARRGARVRRLLVVMRKFANRKYRIEFGEFSRTLLDAVRRNPERFPGAERPLAELLELYRRRVSG